VSGGVPFLMNICLISVYIRGVIGHVDRACCKKLGKDEPAPYSKDLRFIPPRRPPGGQGYRSQEYRGALLGRSGGVGS